jgi:hypothetical protein
LKELLQLFGAEVTPLAGLELAEFDVHDTDAPEGIDFIVEVGAHAANLAVEALGEHNAEGIAADFFGDAGLGDGA